MITKSDEGNKNSLVYIAVYMKIVILLSTDGSLSVTVHEFDRWLSKYAIQSISRILQIPSQDNAREFPVSVLVHYAVHKNSSTIKPLLTVPDSVRSLSGNLYSRF